VAQRTEGEKGEGSACSFISIESPCEFPKRREKRRLDRSIVLREDYYVCINIYGRPQSVEDRRVEEGGKFRKRAEEPLFGLTTVPPGRKRRRDQLGLKDGRYQRVGYWHTKRERKQKTNIQR